MRAYTVPTAAITLGVSRKWLDNALSHYKVEGVIQSRQGVSRRLSHQAILIIHISLRLVDELHMPLERALQLATGLSGPGLQPGTIALSRGLSISIDLDQSLREVNHRLESAVEITPLPRRGRPARK